jgi:hypothetical protein
VVRWKAVFLAILLVSAVAVTLGVTVAELHVMNVLNRGFRQVADPIRPLDVIDDENPPG